MTGTGTLTVRKLRPSDLGRLSTVGLRTRKLLLHRREIEKLVAATQGKGTTLIPVRLYFRNGRVNASSRSPPAIRSSGSWGCSRPPSSKAGRSSKQSCWQAGKAEAGSCRLIEDLARRRCVPGGRFGYFLRKPENFF